jgi:hypothetical protein
MHANDATYPTNAVLLARLANSRLCDRPTNAVLLSVPMSLVRPVYSVLLVRPVYSVLLALTLPAHAVLLCCCPGPLMPPSAPQLPGLEDAELVRLEQAVRTACVARGAQRLVLTVLDLPFPACA